jgi:putative DNA primase/helicase
MNDLLQRLSDDGFSIPNLLLNSKVVRFDRTGQRSGWFVGFENKSKSGESYIVAVYGDWKTGEKYEFKTKREYTKSESTEILKRISVAQGESERERLALQESAKREAQYLWSTGGDNPGCDYLSRKSINALYGCRTILREDGRTILVPMRDSSGELWGVQTINGEGKKYFTIGQRINGLFHVIGGDITLDETIYIAEGFATAATIHQAIGKPVVVAFNAGNLVNVAKELKEKYESAKFVVCGDEDQFTMREDKPYNPGREFGDKAAKACTGVAVYPKFTSLESKPTDFNDLHILEGIKTVKDQILGTPEVESQYLLCLGFNSEKFFYTSSENNYIKTLSPVSHNKNNLLSLIGLNYWQSIYPAKSEDGVDWTLAIDDLMDKCRKKGSFNLNNVRATGAWLGEKKELILNKGDVLIVNGRKVGFHGLKSKYIYEPSDMTIAEPSASFLSTEECHYFLETLNMLKWAHPDYYKYLAGWLMIAPICGALEWRPHLWLSGPSGSGKSTIMNEVVHLILDKTGLFFQGQTTEAGIRQSLGKKSLPVVFDEFETNDEKSGQRIAALVELIRQASYESNGYVTKGSSTGESINYATRFMAIVSSIGVNLPNEADKNRFTVIELKRSSDSQEQSIEHFQEFKRRLRVINDEWVHSFYSRIFNLWPVFLQNRELLFKEIAKRYSSRLAQQYSPLLAGFQLLQSEVVLSEAEAKLIVDDTDLEFKSKEVDENDETECLKHLLTKGLHINGGINTDTTVFEMIKNSRDSVFQKEEWVASLRRNGIVVKDNYLLVSNNNSQINGLYKGTKWVGMYHRSLVRLKGSDTNGNKPVWMNGASTKVVRIPLSLAGIE